MMQSINVQCTFEGPGLVQAFRAARVSKDMSCLRAFRPGNLRVRGRQRSAVKAVSKNDLDDLEMQVAILNQEMLTAAKEERFKEAAQFRDRLETLHLKQRCMQVEHREGLRESICHRIGEVQSAEESCDEVQPFVTEMVQVILGSRQNLKFPLWHAFHFLASESWIQSMGVDTLAHGRHQPFYQVLADERDRAGGMITYVAQENIASYEGAEDQNNPVQHKQIKQMFSSFDASTHRFVPTKELLAMYPDSIEAREEASGNEA